jgi:S-adenosylmethionine:tRNA ribosyltransferase-isomerase
MKVSDFHYSLPDGLIAQAPLPERSASRLLLLDRSSGVYRDSMFSELPQLLREGDLLVFNDTRVIPARLFARKETGGRVEILVERLLGESEALVQLRASKPTRPGSVLRVEGADECLEVTGQEGSFFRLGFHGGRLSELLDAAGHVPLPPYITRADDTEDRERYQTIYAREPGAVAAPTAGLHFDDNLLAQLDGKGIARGFVTLHVGAGTFQPVRVDQVEDHEMHAERIEVPESLCRLVSENHIPVTAGFSSTPDMNFGRWMA